MLREEKSKAGINKMSGTKTEMRGFSADCASGSAPMTWSDPEIRGSAAHDLSRAASLDERLLVRKCRTGLASCFNETR